MKFMTDALGAALILELTIACPGITFSLDHLAQYEITREPYGTTYEVMFWSRRDARARRWGCRVNYIGTEIEEIKTARQWARRVVEGFEDDIRIWSSNGNE